MKQTAQGACTIKVFVLSLAASFFWYAGLVYSEEPAEWPDLLKQAETVMLMGINDLGAGRSFEQASELLDLTAQELESGQLSAQELEDYQRQVEAAREDLDILTELYKERFFGVYPLARLTKNSLVADEGLAVTEQMFHPPDTAATLMAAQKLSRRLAQRTHPHVVFRSVPPNRMLENVAAEVLVRNRSATVVSRRHLVASLDDGQLAAFDSGQFEPELTSLLSSRIDAVNLYIVTIGETVSIDKANAIKLKGSVYTAGEVIQGGPMDATLSLRVENFSFTGYSRDRRGQYAHSVVTQLAMLLFSLVWASGIRWNKQNPFTITGRIIIGALLFFYGRLFVEISSTLLHRYMPEETAMVVAAWWWPAVIGLLAIVVVGFLAWIAQARITNIMPGMRGARAVGTIFALSALGAASYFVAPLLLLDGTAGFANFTPFLVASISLALLFGFAARTGPPVPHYFMVFPLLIAPLVGTSLFMASPPLVWLSSGIALASCLAAWLRHRTAVAGGWEEPEPSEDEAAQSDHESLIKLQQRFKK